MTLKPVDTAIIMVVGPCIDDTDFKSLEEAIAYNAAGMDISLIVEKTDGTSAVTAITLTTGGTSDWTHKDGGYYEVEITAAQNAEEGVAYVRGVCTGVLPFESVHYDIVKANIYDSLIKGTDVLHADVTQWIGTAAATPTVAGVPEVDITYCGGSAVAAGAIPNAAADAAGGLPISDTGNLDLDTKLANTNEITSARMGALTDWINGGRLDAILDLCAVEANVGGHVNTSLSAYNGPTDAEMIAAFTEIKGATWAAGTDTLKHIRDKQTDIETDTAQIGTAGAGLTALGDTRIGNLDAAISSRLAPAGTLATVTALTNAPTNGDLTTTMKTSVNDQVVDVMKTDTTTEMSQGAPPATPTMEEMQAYIYFKLRNKGLTTATEDAMYDNAGTTKLMKATLSDNGTTFEKSEYISGV